VTSNVAENIFADPAPLLVLQRSVSNKKVSSDRLSRKQRPLLSKDLFSWLKKLYLPLDIAESTFTQKAQVGLKLLFLQEA